MKLDLGCGPYRPEGFIGVDSRLQPGVDIVADLNCSWPFKDSSVVFVRASHIFEHLSEPLFTMAELFRILKPGGRCEIDVPSSNGPGAFQDPTHKSFWNLNSFIYYDHKIELGGMYDCNKWIVRKRLEYLTPGLEMFGPYVKAVVEKPGGPEELCQ